MNPTEQDQKELSVEDLAYEKLIREMLEIVKEKSNEKDSSIRESIIQALSKFKY